jgi:hypothetical protein
MGFSIATWQFLIGCPIRVYRQKKIIFFQEGVHVAVSDWSTVHIYNILVVRAHARYYIVPRACDISQAWRRSLFLLLLAVVGLIYRARTNLTGITRLDKRSACCRAQGAFDDDVKCLRYTASMASVLIFVAARGCGAYISSAH